jgi:hypothetical protein
MRLKHVLTAVLFLVSVPAHAQVFGTNSGTFVDWLQSYGPDSVPLRYPGVYQQGYNPAPASVVSGFAPVITGNAGLYSNAMNYPNASGYTLQFTAPNPAAITTSLSGMFQNLTNVHINGNQYTANFTLQHDGGNLLASGAEIDFAGASNSNPITNVAVIQPGGTLGGLTKSYQGYLGNYQAVRWMNNNNINNNNAPMTAANLLPSGQNIGTNGNSYTDIINWSNQQTNLQKVWVNIPVNADTSFIKAVADQFATGLAPGKQVIFEYGNENWNFAFTHPGLTILPKGQSDPRVNAGDNFTVTAQESGLQAAAMMQTIKAEYAAKGVDPSRAQGFLGSQGANQYFVDQSKSAINRVYGAGTVGKLFTYQGISFYPADNLASAGSVDQILSAVYTDLARQKQYLANDKADAAASGLAEAIYEWSPNGYLTAGGVPASVVNAFRADPRAKQWTLDEYSAIKSILGPNDMAMEFSVLGDGWSAQINPLGPAEPEQQAIQQISAGLSVGSGTPIVGALTPEPSCLGLIGLAVTALMARRRRS